MTHKDPITGCEVADIFEVFTPDELEDIYASLDEDTRRWEKHLEEDLFNLVVKYIQDDCDSEDPIPLPVEKVSSTMLKCSQGFSGCSWKGELVAKAADGIVYKYTMSYWDNGNGDFYEPPCEEIELDFIAVPQ